MAADADMALIVEQWTKREQQISSARFQWVEKRTVPKGTLDIDQLVASKQDQIFPKEDVTNSHAWAVVLGGKAMFYSREGPTWDRVLGEFVDASTKFSFDGEIGKMLHGAVSEILWTAPGSGVGKPGSIRPLGYIRKSLVVDYFGNYHFHPITITCRPLQQPISRFQPAEWTVAAACGIVNGHECLVLNRRHRLNEPSGLAQIWWVDPNRDFVVLP